MTTYTGASPLTMRGVNGSYFLSLRAQQQAATYRLIASVFDTDQPSEEYPWVAEAQNLVKWEGERTLRKLRSEKVTIVTDDYETGISIKKRDFTRDKTGQMQLRVQDLAFNVSVFPTQLLTDLMVANGNAYDGKAFFAADHVNGNSGTIDNIITSGELAGGATPTVAEQSANLLFAFSRLVSFRNAAGQPLNEAAKEFVVMVPANMYATTLAAVNAMFTSAGATNPMGELANAGVKFAVVLNARLPANTWYLMRVDAGIRPFIVQEEDVTPVQLGLDSEHCAKTNHVYFGHGWAGGAGYGRFELALSCVPV
jgi:phage major head subunit gpT-like protein